MPDDPIPSDTVLVETEAGGDSLAAVVVEAVSVVTDTPPTELPPISRVIDTDALDQLFPDADVAGVLTFSYHDHTIHVTPDRRVAVCEPDDPIPVL